MENTRRLFDRSRELGLKKPRLEEQKIIGRNSNARAFIQSPAEPASMRGRESEGSDTSSRLGAIQELVSQYRTALAELTFNSKPIITNLTIIAGENLNAAKPIAAVICSNIIEVPTEQKLPSLYLLDSIVKNIGRDYIKYFAARLPEVFCKAYKQVDPSVHPGMRHLFGTWKNVFPPQSLQMIENELGFPTAVSGSALGTATSKAVSQSQRPAQSIHVNPRYLEARERQQSSTVKGISNYMNGGLADSPDDTEKLERSNVYSERRRADPRLKMHNIQHPPRSAGRELVQQKNLGARDFSTELAKQSVLGIGKASDRVTEQEIDGAWYGSGSTLTGTTSNQNYGFDINLRHTNRVASRSATDDVNLQHSQNLSGRSNIGMDKSWKNLEEEEYTWDDVNSRSTTYGVNHKSKRDPRFMDDSERLDSKNPCLQPQIVRETGSSVHREASSASLMFEQRNQAVLEKHAPLMEARTTLGIGFLASDQTIPGRSEGRTTSLMGLSTNANSTIRTSLQGSSSINSSFQQRHHIPSLHKFQSDPIQYDPSAPSHKPVLLQISTLNNSSMIEKFSSGNISTPASEIPGQMSTSCLLTAVMESGILGKNSGIGGIPKLSCQTAISLPSQTSSRPTQPSDPPPTQLESKAASVTLVSSLLHEKTSVSLAQKQTEQPPLPSKPPRSSIVGTASEETTTATSNPVSNLLDSLVSRGLISAEKSESSAPIPLQNICDTQGQVQGIMTAPLMNSTRQVFSDILPSSTSIKLSLLKPTETPSATHVSNVNEIKSHIGFEFKPEVIRVPHPEVISELLGDLPHQCGICGLRVKIKEHLGKHMEWHTLKKSDSDSSCKASRRWYVKSVDWVEGKVSTLKTSDVLEVSNDELENRNELMVPADENHCVCVLCGELFEDLYNLKMSEWMFRGAVYLTPTPSKITSTAVAQGPIVHASCISESSVRELELANNVKAEEDA